MTTNRETFAQVYEQSFKEAYPQLPADKAEGLIKKAIYTALADIKSVSIDGAAFKLTAKKLGIKRTYKAFQEYLDSDKPFSEQVTKKLGE